MIATTTSNVRTPTRAFKAHAQVDAIVVLPTSHKHNTAALLAVAQSNLEGNEWGAIVSLVDAASGTQRCALQLATGVSALAWCGADRELLALACDNGDVQLVQLARVDDSHAFVPQSNASLSASPVQTDDTSDAVTNSSSTATHTVATFGHDDVVTSVSASHLDATHIATSSWDATVKLWDVTRLDTTLATLDGHTDLIWDVACNNQNANVLASAAQDCTVQLWDTRASTAAVLALAVRTPALALDWHPQRETLVSIGLDDGSVLTFDTRAPRAALLDATPHTGAVHTVQYSPFHADVLASGGDDARVCLRTGGAAHDVAERRHRDYVRALAWLSDDANESDNNQLELVTGSWDKTMQLWPIDHDAPADAAAADQAAPGM